MIFNTAKSSLFSSRKPYYKKGRQNKFQNRKRQKIESFDLTLWHYCSLKAAENRARQTHPRLSKRWKNRLEARQEPDLQHVADVKVENFEDLAKDQELVLSVSLAGQLDLTNKLSVEGSI